MPRKKNKEKLHLPSVGDEQFVTWLPRDISLGWSYESPKGMPLYGWCLTTDTMQLWETTGEGANAKAKFVGFVCFQPD